MISNLLQSDNGKNVCWKRIFKLVLILMICLIIIYYLRTFNQTSSFSSQNYLQYIRFNKNKDSLHLCKYNSTYTFFYSLTNRKLYNEYVMRAHILMQSRYDGFIGFPGGNAPKNINLTTSLKRELREEMNLPSQYVAEEKDYMFSHRSRKNGLCLHMYEKKLTQDDLAVILKALPYSPVHGTEILGYVMPPLIYVTHSALKLEGFPVFLTQKFVGNSVQQLFDGLIYLNIMSSKEIEKAWQDSLLVRNAVGTDLAHFNE